MFNRSIIELATAYKQQSIVSKFNSVSVFYANKTKSCVNIVVPYFLFIVKRVETDNNNSDQKKSVRCDPIALAKRYTQCAPINFALCSTVMHSKPRSVSHCQAQQTSPLALLTTVRHSKPPPVPPLPFCWNFNPCVALDMHLRNLPELSYRKQIARKLHIIRRGRLYIHLYSS